ncbi:MAG: hypothetical protein H6728_15365 [Myxococcales bacterium]|nr:hypothetical protein [Myxococcales bacterium]
MPVGIRDKQLSQVMSQIDRQPAKKIDDENVLQLLASVGDRNADTSTTVLGRLTQPGISRKEQFEEAKAGLSNKERDDLTSLLGRNDLQWTPNARNFIEALVGRSELSTENQQGDSLALPAALKDKLSSVAKPGETLEIVNVSDNPQSADGASKMEVKVDQWGRFSGQLDGVKEGDHLRVRSRGANGNVSNWINLQAQGMGGEDTHNAKIKPEEMGLEANGRGSVDLVHLGNGMVSEPGAQVRLTNQRTGENFDFTLDANGNLPSHTTVGGKAGDTFSIAVSDGTNNVDFKETAGTTKVMGAPEPIDLQEPEPWKKRHVNEDGTPNVKAERFSGPLFENGVRADDVKQGSLANCYLVAAASAVAGTDPDAIKNMIKDNGNGTYTVNFKERDYRGRVTEKSVTVDGDLFVRPDGSALYGAGMNSKSKDQMEMWFPIFEKAYATYKGNSYDKIGNGGSSADVMKSILGANTTYSGVEDYNADRVFDSLKKAQENGWPATAATYGKDGPEAERYSGQKIYPWHAYTVLGVQEEDGKKFVQLRNPWGSTEPGYDGKDDGIFRLELKDFVHYYSGVTIAQG